jgi:hypothetical protein
MKKPNHPSNPKNTFLNKYTMIIYFLITFLFYSIMSLGQTKEKWVLKKDKSGIKVYIRIEPVTGLPEFKGIIKIAASIPGLIAVLRDVEEYPNLFAGTKTANILREEDNLLICYMHNECPFPFSDRDGIYKSYIYHNPVNGKVTLSIEALPDYLPEYSKKVRIVTSKGLWTLKPLKDGKVEVIYQQYADPGGNFPIWMIKLYSVSIPYKALIRLRRQVQLPKYQFVSNESTTRKEQINYEMGIFAQ